MADTGWGVMLMTAALLLPLITQSNAKYQQYESRVASFGITLGTEKLGLFLMHWIKLFAHSSG